LDDSEAVRYLLSVSETTAYYNVGEKTEVSSTPAFER
jgi:hypothetical protein